MGVPFDYVPERPEHIDVILNGLDRYNPETTTVFQDYVMQQCENQTYDCYANLALLKLGPKLNILRNLLERADYEAFWETLNSDDLYADLYADVSGFEELMRVRIAVTVSQAVREVDRSVLEGWLNLRGQEFEHFVGEVCGWSVDGSTVKVPLNKENEAKGTVVRENVKFEQFSRLIRRAYEQPA
ncbi:hypothetical protein H2199_002338 [Coniosporium tulheliwenetii]|uniref:Uncharacterized protein n=1 Tax=Coniosporium tulheliwenetii TaxID=3383036 RepID=A0ACC2ZIH0_9PEZI|nr:hypothetical protein H2199_002338 [Cladosporium sp. JES 115]